MKIAVCVKHVPEGVKRIDASSKRLDRSGEGALNAFDANAVEESVQLIAEAIPILEEALGEDHPRVAISVSILGHGLRAKGDFAGAERNYRRALAIDERANGRRHPQTLDDVRTLAEFLRERGRPREAAALEKRLVNAAK